MSAAENELLLEAITLVAYIVHATSEERTVKILVTSTSKGGDGKTALSRMCAEYLARSGKRVLAIDVDPQCNLSQRLLGMDHDPTSVNGVMPPVHPDFNPNEADPDYPSWDGRSSISDIFYGKPAVPYATNVEGLDILPGNGVELRGVELVTAADVQARVVNQIEIFLSQPEVRESYDVVVIDTSPSQGPLTQAAMRAATHVLIPCQMEPNSIDGLSGMLEMVMRENTWRPTTNQVHLIGVIVNKFRKGVSVQEGFRDVLFKDPATLPFMLPMSLALRTAFAERDSPVAQPKSIFDLPANNFARREAEALCSHVMEVLTQ